MTSVSDTTVSPTPFSPFSSRSYSSTSGLTSDDAPDLGAFTTVFRALNDFHQTRNGGGRYSDGATPISSLELTASDSEPIAGSTVWSQRPIASYLSSTSSPFASTSLTQSSRHEAESTTDRYSATDPYLEAESSALDPILTEESERDETEDFEEDDNDLDPSDQPSLGLFGALDFIAAERARFAAQRDAAGNRGNSSTTSDGTWRHPVPPRRKRRRKRTRSAHSKPRKGTAETIVPDVKDETGATVSQDDSDDSSSSLDIPASPQYYKSTPPSPPPQPDRRRQKATGRDKIYLHQSKSTPTLRLPASLPIDARVLQLRNLAHKLRLFFPKDAAFLSAILSDDHPSHSDFVDPRGPMPRAQDTLIHVFIDHSNILFGFLAYLKRHTHRTQRKPRQISHAALALILERGRPITRRVLVTSSPLYQPVESAEQLGYDVKVLRRVPDTGDGADRLQPGSSSSDQRPHLSHSSSSSPVQSRKQVNRRSYTKGHAHKTSIGGGATSESDSIPNGGRVRYREQGVDELLQLKVHQAIADVDDVPPNATIVLATGDGNVGQFNEDGFLGCVRTALKKGWKVELYAWEGSLSKAWKREFDANERFVVHSLDRFAVDLVEL